MKKQTLKKQDIRILNGHLESAQKQIAAGDMYKAIPFIKRAALYIQQISQQGAQPIKPNDPQRGKISP